MAEGGNLPVEIRLEEFRQINEFMRQSMDSMLTVTNTAVVGTATYIAAVVAFVFSRATEPGAAAEVVFAYLFVLPLPVLAFCLGVLSGYRDDLYRFQCYVIVYFEHELDTIGWGSRVIRFRAKSSGESFDLVQFIFWTFFLVSCALYTYTLFWMNSQPRVHLLVMLPFFALMFYQSRRFSRNRLNMVSLWAELKEEERGARVLASKQGYGA